MLAMRAAQPCVVHGVGGLRDTVSNEETGFVFNGDDLRSQATGFVAATLSALALRRVRPKSWAWVRRRAKALRFEWSASAAATIHSLYEAHDA